MKTVKLVDVTVTERMAEIPEKCPHCGVDFVGTYNLRVIRYDCTSWDGKLAKTEQDRAEDGNDFIYSESWDTIHEEFVEGLEYRCNECSNPVISGKLERKKPEPKPAITEELRFAIGRAQRIHSDIYHLKAFLETATPRVQRQFHLLMRKVEEDVDHARRDGRKDVLVRGRHHL